MSGDLTLTDRPLFQPDGTVWPEWSETMTEAEALDVLTDPACPFTGPAWWEALAHAWHLHEPADPRWFDLWTCDRPGRVVHDSMPSLLVYRGEGDDQSGARLSWCRDLPTAAWFAARSGQRSGVAVVLSGAVAAADVLAWDAGEGGELIVRPGSVEITQRFTIAGPLGDAESVACNGGVPTLHPIPEPLSEWADRPDGF